MNKRIARLLLTYPKKEWKQKELISSTKYSKGFISQEVKALSEECIVSKIDKKIILVDFPKLLAKWVGTGKLPKPIYFRTRSTESVGKKLGKVKFDYALTLFGAAWRRIKFFKVEKLEIYVKKSDVEKMRKLLGKEDISGNVEVYPAEDDVFAGKEKIAGLFLVSPVQNYVDLMCVGGSGTRVALQLAEKYKLGV
jgi:hypothetical protein